MTALIKLQALWKRNITVTVLFLIALWFTYKVEDVLSCADLGMSHDLGALAVDLSAVLHLLQSAPLAVLGHVIENGLVFLFQGPSILWLIFKPLYIFIGDVLLSFAGSATCFWKLLELLSTLVWTHSLVRLPLDSLSMHTAGHAV